MNSDELINKQNEKIIKDIKRIDEKYSTDNQKIYYEKKKLEYLDNLNWYLFFLFYIFAFIVSFFIFKTEYKLKWKIFFIILVFIYPFVISTITYYIYELIVYIYAIIFGISYKKEKRI